MSSKKSGIKIQESDLLCRNNCGFYGNPSWHYYCSVCYRDVYLKKNFQTKSVVSEVSQNSVSSFSKFEEKRKAVSSKTPNTVKNIFKTNKNDETRDESSDAKEAKIRFDQFLSKMKKAIVQDVLKQVKIHLDALEESRFLKIDQHSVLVQKFYERMYERIESEPLYKGLSEKQAEDLMSELERYLTIQIYDWAFKSNFSDDESIDLELQKRIRSLHWITADVLEAEIDEENAEEIVHFDEAINDMILLNTKLCPQDKLDCIVRCCKSVFSTLQTHAKQIYIKPNTESTDSTVPSPEIDNNNKVVNADDFLPALILILIRANPTLLHSNIQFIMRFARPTLINSGEVGYMFTNVCIAVEFINNLDHKSLNMTQQQFDDAMKGIRSTAITNKYISDIKNGIDKTSLDATFAALRILDNNEQCLKKLDEESESLRNNLIQLENETAAYEHVFTQKINRIRNDIPMNFHTTYVGDIVHDTEVQRKLRPDLDAILNNSSDNDVVHRLPSPLAPIRSSPISNTDKENWDQFLQ